MGTLQSDAAEPVNYGAEALAFIDSLNSLKTKEDVLKAVQAALSRFGFEHFVVTELPHAFREHHPEVLLAKVPIGWMDLYFNRDYQTADPVVRCCRRTALPFEWRDVRVDPEREPIAVEIMCRARDHGLVGGFTIPIQGLNGVTSCFSMSASTATYLNQFTRPAIHLMALYAFERARNLQARRSPTPSVLTDREREVISWAAVGKSAAEIADILNITERTAVAHTINATQKLGAKNKTQAVAKAILGRMIEP